MNRLTASLTLRCIRPYEISLSNCDDVADGRQDGSSIQLKRWSCSESTGSRWVTKTSTTMSSCVTSRSSAGDNDDPELRHEVEWWIAAIGAEFRIRSGSGWP